MYTLIKKIGWKSLLGVEAPSLLAAWLIAEAFFKFGSFTLETASFLGTWYLLGGVIQILVRRPRR
jgi:hypothetical protein